MYQLLLVEDDLNTCEIIKMYMSRINHKLHIQTLHSSLQLVDVNSYDLI